MHGKLDDDDVESPQLKEERVKQLRNAMTDSVEEDWKHFNSGNIFDSTQEGMRMEVDSTYALRVDVEALGQEELREWVEQFLNEYLDFVEDGEVEIPDMLSNVSIDLEPMFEAVYQDPLFNDGYILNRGAAQTLFDAASDFHPKVSVEGGLSKYDDYYVSLKEKVKQVGGVSSINTGGT